MDENNTGDQAPTNAGGDQTSITDEVMSGLDESVQKHIKTLSEQKKHWRGKAVDPETGKSWKELHDAKPDKVDKTTDKDSKDSKDSKDDKNDSPKELGLGEKAYLLQKGVETKEEQELVRKTMEESGKGLEELLDASWFQAELKTLKEAKVAKEAMPDESGRTTPSGAGTVEYWLAKDEVPPVGQTKLRREYVKAKEELGKKTQFTDTPVIGKG